MIDRRHLLLASLATVLLPGIAAVPAFAPDYKLGSLEIEHPWARATPPTAPAAGGFLKIVNKGTAADRLVAAPQAM